jgi:hypothetical protein
LVQQRYEQLHPVDPDKKRIIELENELTRQRVQHDVSKLLVEKDLPIEFAEFFVSTNPKESLAMAQKLVDTFDRLYKEVVGKQLKKMGFTPKNEGQTGIEKKMTKEEFLNLPYDKRIQLYNSDPYTYGNLLKNGY